MSLEARKDIQKSNSNPFLLCDLKLPSVEYSVPTECS